MLLVSRDCGEQLIRIRALLTPVYGASGASDARCNQTKFCPAIEGDGQCEGKDRLMGELVICYLLDDGPTTGSLFVHRVSKT